MRSGTTRLVAVLALALAACGGNSDGRLAGSPSTSPGPATTAAPVPTTGTTNTTGSATTSAPAEEGGFPVTVEIDGASVTIPQRPTRIAALSATHVEMLYAMGAGEQLVAGDLFSNYPAEATNLEQLDSFNLSVEGLIALAPDLVVLSFDPVDAVAALEAVGIPTLLLGTAPDLEAVYRQIAALGMASGNGEGAESLSASMESAIDGIVAGAGEAGDGVTYYHETDPFSFYTPNSDSFIGRLYALLGMENIADAASDELSSGFPQLSPEFIITTDPDFVFLAGAGESAATLAQRPGWETLSALSTDRVFVLDPDVASRWGPRIVDLMAAIADAVAGAAP